MDEPKGRAGRFAGKRAIVTGAASGIGRATALLLAQEGARIVIADRDAEGLAETRAIIGEAATAVVYDAADTASCHALVDQAVADGALDIVCNIAGMLDWGPTADFGEDRFIRLLQVNLVGVYALCRAALPHLLKSGGNIVNTASTAGLTGTAYSVGYAASKHGVVGLTRSLSLELAAQGVRVNAVCPGHVDTPMGNKPPPPGDIDWRLAMRAAPKLKDGICAPVDVARAIAYLASDDARTITGSTLVIDGGQLAG